MTYGALAEMQRSASLRARIVAAAAMEGIVDPEGQLQNHLWKVVSKQVWVDRWQDAVVNYTPVFNPDTGARPDVITDDLIRTAVQALIPQ